MNRKERIMAALHGKEVDRVPVSAWLHFSEVDQDPVSLAKAQISFVKKYDFDFIKMMPQGTYPVQDWGAQLKKFEKRSRRLDTVKEGAANKPSKGASKNI